MILGIIIFVIEVIFIPLMWVGYVSGLLSFFNMTVVLICVVASIVDMVVCIARIKRMHGNRKGRAIAGLVISAHTLFIGLANVVAFLGGYSGIIPIPQVK